MGMKSVEVTIEVEFTIGMLETGLGRQGYPVGLYYYNKFRNLRENKAKTIQGRQMQRQTQREKFWLK